MKNKKLVEIVDGLLAQLEELADTSQCQCQATAYGYCKKLVNDAFAEVIYRDCRVHFPGVVITLYNPNMVDVGEYVRLQNGALVSCAESHQDCCGIVVSRCTAEDHVTASMLVLNPICV